MRTISVILASVLVLFLALAFQSQGPLRGSDQTVASDTTLAVRIGLGAELFSKTCQRCHNPRGPAERTDREWVMIMQHMRTRANLTQNQTNLVRDFLLASNSSEVALPVTDGADNAAIEITDELIDLGRDVYAGAGTCFACHGGDLGGGPIAPNLNDADWKNGDGDFESILNTIRKGVSGSAMAAYPAGISDEQAQQVAAYVWAISQGQVDS